jgi:hypothetical protein
VTWVLNIELNLHTLGKSHSFMKYNSLYTLLDLICNILLHDLMKEWVLRIASTDNFVIG